MTSLIVPEMVTYTQLTEGLFLSPSNYKKFDIPNKNTILLCKLLDKEPIRGTEIGSTAYTDKSPFYFMRTQAARSSQFTLFNDDESFVPCKRQDFNKVYIETEENIVRAGDIFYVKGGNVVPVRLGQAIAKSIKNHIGDEE